MTDRTQPRSLARDAGPAPAAGRGFRPNYLSFAGTYQCNLACPHCCVPIEWTDRLDITTAVRFLEQAHAEGIDTLGFTGGEPFVYPEFLVPLTRRAAALGFRFDKLMTNGVWYDDAAHLGRVGAHLEHERAHVDGADRDAAVDDDALGGVGRRHVPLGGQAPHRLGVESARL